jgi:hypothetical protein
LIQPQPVGDNSINIIKEVEGPYQGYYRHKKLVF